MLTVLDRLSLPGSPDRPNEDAFGVAGDWAWVLDGSIPPGVPPIMGEASDAVWLVRFAGERFAALTRGCADGRALIARVIGEARDAFLAKAPEERREPLTWPAAALTLVRVVAGDRLDAWTLADTVALVRRPDGAVSALNDAAALRAFETDAAADMLKRTGTDPESVRATPEFRVWMEAGRRARPGDGVHGFGLRPEALGRLRQEAAAVSPGTVVLLASDGFAALSDAYGCWDAAGLMEAALARGLAPLGRELRRVETEVDPSGRRFPRFKRSDDATALLMRVS